MFQWQHSAYGKPRYLQVRLWRQNKARTFYVHDLVAAAFIGKKPRGAQVNHKDLDKKNNYAENLEYLTPKENMDHAVKGGVLFGGARRKNVC